MVTSTGNNVVIPNIITAKVCLVGESQTGKTSLVKQLVSDGTNFPRVSLLISVAIIGESFWNVSLEEEGKMSIKIYFKTQKNICRTI